MTARAEKIMSRINALAALTDQPGIISRVFGTPAFVAATKLLVQWFNEAGLKTRVDNIGNVRGRLNSAVASNKTFVIASHYDTVINAGKFDGPLGIVMGLDIIEHLIAEQITLPFNIELIAFSDEEGVRYHSTYLGSKVVTGNFDNTLLTKKDNQHITLSQAIAQIGGDVSQLNTDKIKEQEWLGYFEIHIEQGPILYEADIPVAGVSAIAGQKRVTITCVGEAGHAGTVPTNMRRDALCCAADCINQLEYFAKKHENILATVGTLHIINAASNVIPGNVNFSVDLRSADEDALDTAWHDIQSLVTGIGHKRNIETQLHLIQSSLPVKCDYTLNFLLKRAIAELGYEVKELVSGAGHDGVPVSLVSPVCMMFVRCFKGISHNPNENVDVKDIEAASIVADHFLLHLIKYYNQE